MDYVSFYQSPAGNMMMASSGSALSGLWFSGQKYFAETLHADHKERQLPVFDETKRWLDTYFSGREPDFTPPLDMRATAFRRAVWEILLTIPYGRTATYGEIAKKVTGSTGIGRMAARAVGGAVGHNAILLIIPCHRVIGSDGNLTGYAGGIERKIRLLEMEQVHFRADGNSGFSKGR